MERSSRRGRNSPSQSLRVPLLPEVAPDLFIQEYGEMPMLSGVWQRPLVKHRSVNGWFLELLRASDGLVDGLPPDSAGFPLRQVSLSQAAPARINAFHLHAKRAQDELWTVIEGQLLVWLVDCRAVSPTAAMRQKFILSGEQPSQLYVPAGVAHGYRSGPDGALLVYAMNEQFVAHDSNEGRLPWNYFGAELWEEDRG